MTDTAQAVDSTGEKLYTIGTVSKLTGVGAITLRAWERRYGLIKPVRKPSGHRLYTRAHIDQVNRITALTQQGVRISQIRPEMLDTEAAGDGGRDADYWHDSLNGMIAAIVAFDEDRLEEIYNECLSLYSVEEVTRRLLTPLLIELGLRWENSAGSVAEEHFFAFYLRNKLGARYHHRPRGNRGPLLLLAGLPGEHHEIGLLLFSLAALQRGYRVLPLGPNLPLEEAAPVSRASGCAAVILTGAIEPSRSTLSNALPALVDEVKVPVLVGGQSSVFACEAINRAGAEALGRDIAVGLQRLGEILNWSGGQAGSRGEKGLPWRVGGGNTIP